LDAKSTLRVGLKITNHPPAPAKKIIRGILRKIRMEGMAMVVDQKESTRTHSVTTTEARTERSMPLTEIKIVVDI
jgi:hypothetical protein